MGRDFLEQLVKYSYTKNELDAQKVAEVAKRLNRKQLKQYLAALKKYERQHTVYIEYVVADSTALQNKFEEIFPGKKLVFIHNPDIISGIRVTQDDMIYTWNLKDTLDRMVESITESI